jgi:hypothetical protein
MCSDGRHHGVADGWHLTMHEAMAKYQYTYGFKPMGPHRALVHELLGAYRASCVRCNGRGVVDLGGGTDWRGCPECETTGGYWTCTEEYLTQARLQVVKEFPDSQAPEGPARFLGVGLVFDLDAKTIRDTDRPKSE